MLTDIARPGDVVNTVAYPQAIPFWQFWKWLQRWAMSAIKRHQKRRYPDCQYTNATHTVLLLDNNEFFECTVPRSRIGQWSELEGKHLRIYRLRDWGAGEIRLLRLIADPLTHKPYDYLELLTHLVGEVLGYQTPATWLISKVWGIGKDNYVCSVGVRTVLERFRKTSLAYPKLFWEDVELTAPATFECGETPFGLIAELNKPCEK